MYKAIPKVQPGTIDLNLSWLTEVVLKRPK